MEVVDAAARVLLANATNMTLCNQTIIQKDTTWQDLWHPYFLLWTGHCLVAAAFTALSLYVPNVTAGIILSSGLTFLISAIGNIPIWGYLPGVFEWNGVFVKWIIVDLLATVPVLLMRGLDLKPKVVKIIGIAVYVILGSNVVWTMGAESHDHVIVYINRVAGCSLTISLIMHCIAVCRQGFGLFEVKNGFPYGFGTSLPWIVCYTIWNVFFAIRIGVGTVLQDILFWCMMIAYRYFDSNKLPLELYFGFARPVQLGSYIAFTEAMGAFVPYFYNSPTLTSQQPLAVYQNGFVLFICVMNMFWSFAVVFWAGQRLFCGLGFFKERFEEVHAIKKSGILIEEGSEYSEESDEE